MTEEPTQEGVAATYVGRHRATTASSTFSGQGFDIIRDLAGAADETQDPPAKMSDLIVDQSGKGSGE